tara:strand:+ start:320068 stop:321615 length:1548 start_codon:yes stop_codon:yes gene_type:complete
VCIVATGCTVLGPDFTPAERPTLPPQWSVDDTSADQETIANWWQRFNDPVLTTLIEQGAAQNLSLQAAGLRIVQARAALGISDALTLPQQQQLNANLSEVYRKEDWSTSAGVSFDAAWEIDLWGKYARGIESAEATLYASVASYRNVLVSVSAEIARNYINYRTAEERIFLSQQNIAIQQRVVDMTQVQFEAGNVTELDVQQARTQLYATQSSLPLLNITRIQARNALAVLLGTTHENVDALLRQKEQRALADFNRPLNATLRANVTAQDYVRLSVIPVPPELDTRVNAQLVMRRPDLQVAELQARAQSARIGLTQAQLYPSFFLLGSAGLAQSVASGDSFSASEALTANIGPGLSWNVFNYGRIKNQVRIEDARFQESLVNYNDRVLRAINEVTTALESYRYSREKSRYDSAGVEASIRAFNISANQYNNGLVTYQRLLSTVEKMTVREDAYAQTRGNIANQVVTLYKALGGGWEPFQDAAIVNSATVEQMKARTDWGNQLDSNEQVTGADRGE